LFAGDLAEARAIAKKVFPNFHSHNDKMQILLISLCFNLGEKGINKFVKFKEGIAVKNYKTAAKELKNSKWFYQVGDRGRDYVNILNTI
jgi:lysozyme